MRLTARFGVTLCTPGDVRVLKKYVCFNERGACNRGRALKRRYPDHTVRVTSLLPGDRSPPIDIALMPLKRGNP